MIREHDNVVLTHDIEEHGLENGDVGVAVHCYADARAFEVEFMTKEGHTAAVLTLTEEDIRSMNQEEKMIHLLDVQMNELDHIVSKAEKDNDFGAANKSLSLWKSRTTRLFSQHIDRRVPAGEMQERIVVDPNIHFGKPCLASTRIPVLVVLELVCEGIHFEEIINNYYPDLHLEDIQACVRYAMDVLGVEDLHVAT